MTSNSADLSRSALTRAAALLHEIRNGGVMFDAGSNLVDTVRQVEAEIAEALAAPAYHVPGPYEIALAVGAALCASGNYATPGAALAAAWFSIPEFYMARDNYVQNMAPMFVTSPREPGGDPDRTNLQPAGRASAESPPEGSDNATEH